MSRKQVPKLLDEALQIYGEFPPLLQLEVKPPSQQHQLELALLETWKLKEVRVVPTFFEDEQVYAALGKAAAEFFWKLAEAKKQFCVGIGWGRSILAMIDALMSPQFSEPLKMLKQLTFVALISVPSAHSPLLLGTAPQSLLGTLMLRFSTKIHPLPFSVSCMAFQNGEPITTMNAIFTGIGIFAKGKLIEAYAHELGLKIKRSRWLGEMLFQFFDRKGHLLPDQWNGRVQALPLINLQKMVSEGKPVVVIAKGKQKAKALIAANKAKLFNCIIVDRSLAKALLKGGA
ncbi:MAG: sugar-binding domain-containing protein [Armatimonadetes bacterium]|nr:sugar-binding domain-containing protein [Armatimonadota bacterium]